MLILIQRNDCHVGTTKINGASWVITVDSKRRVIRDASILIEDNLIKAVDKVANLASEPADTVIDAKNKLVTPGFVNSHMHISYAHAVRGIFPDDLPHQTYLGYVFKLQSVMKPEEEYYTSLLAITELLKSGCTCFLDPGTITSIDSGVRAIRESGIRAVIGREVVDKPNPINIHVMETNEAIKIVDEVIRRYNGELDGRINAWAMPFSPNYCSDELMLSVKEIADRRGVGVTMHMSGSEDQRNSFMDQRGTSPVEHLAKKGILDKNVLLAHALAVNDREVDLIAEKGAKVVHCPSSAVRGSGATKLGKFPEMIDKGICVSLGNDAANSSYYLDPIRLMYLSAVLYKDARQNRAMIPPETAIEMGTINGATALLLGQHTGSIEPGKKADLVVFDTKRPEWRSLFNPINNLVYSADGRSVDTVLVDGNIVIKDQKAQYVNEDDLCDRVQRIGEEVLLRTGISFKYRWMFE